MTAEKSFIPSLVLKLGNKISHNIAATLMGALIIAAVAQIKIPLPFTPVPITGQTFGVALISLLWGKTRGFSAVVIYLIFATTSISFGPTSGYLIGMLVASYLMGDLSDRGWTGKFWSTWLAAFFGSCVILSCGVLVLSLYMPHDTLLLTGVLPFLPGDFLKTLLACFIVRQVAR
ncbi:biotin transporter BioY [Bdellovibrio sp. ZAP7]|uniref:biotin transporter BioY n=1 Tax=Bdellovibrio sp. ZAP7 TaxID=2231053 RepID=UPI00115A0BC0|nr:biotin transporter BioY [Bdellovibrio sp. ZAP7]QDK46115.1 biotin transporter BioY [Bdellovibrio sp. ZAP7]